jgi:NADH-quinone oxidoreductase subunit J
VAALGRAIFTTYLFPFEATSALLVIAVVGAVVLARRPSGRPPAPSEEGGEPTGGEHSAPPAAEGKVPASADDVEFEVEEVHS